MELILSLEEEKFRDEVRDFVSKEVSEEIHRKTMTGFRLNKEDHESWQRKLHSKGWMAPGWPVEYGGTGWTPMQKHIFEEECAAGGAPPVIAFGVTMVAPVIMAFGTKEQKDYYLPRILRSDDWWCQGYSEPGSGSDLASLRTKAILNGNHYIVNGQKTWTTMAQHANLMFCLVRTSDEGKRQEGISFLLIDMEQPGVTVQPIKTIDGSVEINNVFLEDVKVPIENLIGEENKGWTYAKYLLGHERTSIAAVGRSKAQLKRLKTIASVEEQDGMPLINDTTFREKIADVEISLLALESLVLRVLSDESAGKGPGPEASFLKIRGTEVQQGITELLIEAIGNYAHPFVPESMETGWNENPVGPEYAASIAPHYFNWRKASIYGGSNEIQKNIIAKAVLGF
ncbi:acyl-CoA dehydrogenase family protein [Rhodospirillaceae bacterium]|jgi:alkylation response protein AidB-like acyl-CoA dehydrogenase|nr:pimeloyl-CoA dehydrogenase large subunit [Rhodospirillaceae bacterium]MDC1441637.1 acyl-CoA dehydrogenase family protein [Rhodospirillaceae bacterium]